MHWAYRDGAWLCGLAGAAMLLCLVALARKWLALRRLARSPAAGSLARVSRPAQAFRALLLLAAGALLMVVLLGPQWGQVPVEADPASGRDVFIVLDVSRSMLAEDARPNRLARAREGIRHLAAALEKEGGYRIGLIAFADRAVLLCPLTSDYRSFEEELNRATLDGLWLRGDRGADDGTQIGLALRRVEQAIDHKQAPYTDILLVSDGGDMEPDTVEAADLLAKAGIPVHAVGVGDPVRASPIPVKGVGGKRAWLEYQGERVQTKLDEEVLRQVASRTGGRYVAAGTGELRLDEVFGAVLADKPARPLQAGGQAHVWVHRFQWFLAPAVALLLLELLPGERSRSAGRRPHRANYFAWVRRRRAPASTPAGANRC